MHSTSRLGLFVRKASLLKSRRGSLASYHNSTARKQQETPPPPPPPSSSNQTNQKSSTQQQEGPGKDDNKGEDSSVKQFIKYFVVGAVAAIGVRNYLLPYLEDEAFNKTKKVKSGEGEEKDELAEIQARITDRVYMDIQFPSPSSSDSSTTTTSLPPPERIVIGLYGDVCPLTTNNFKTLSQANPFQLTPPNTPTNSSSSTTPAYKNCLIHRIIPNFMLQSGDYTQGDGTGGRSIFSTPSFPDESFALKHTGFGVLSMANRGRDTNSSQFFICFQATPWLNGRHVVFGQVLHGITTLRKIEDFGSRSGTPLKEIRIVDCGLLPPLEETLTMNNPQEELDEMGHNAKRIMK